MMEAWYNQVAEGETVICLGDVDGEALAHHQDWWRRAPGTKWLVLGNHDVDPLNQVRPFEVERRTVTLYAAGDPPLLLTHAPLLQVPHGAVNVFRTRARAGVADAQPARQRQRAAAELPAGEAERGLGDRRRGRRRDDRTAATGPCGTMNPPPNGFARRTAGACRGRSAGPVAGARKDRASAPRTRRAWQIRQTNDFRPFSRSADQSVAPRIGGTEETIIHTFDRLTNGATYYIRVAAANDYGQDGVMDWVYSDVVSVTPTVSVMSLAGKPQFAVPLAEPGPWPLPRARREAPSK